MMMTMHCNGGDSDAHNVEDDDDNGEDDYDNENGDN